MFADSFFDWVRGTIHLGEDGRWFRAASWIGWGALLQVEFRIWFGVGVDSLVAEEANTEQPFE